MKVIEEKHNHLNKVYRTVCHNCGSTLEYDDNDIACGLYQDPFVVLCPVCGEAIPHDPDKHAETKVESKTDTTTMVQPTPEECEWLPPLDLGELYLKEKLEDDMKFMRRDGRIATFVRNECPRGSLEFIMMVEGRLYRYNWNGVRLEYRSDHWCEVDEKEDDIIFIV